MEWDAWLNGQPHEHEALSGMIELALLCCSTPDRILAHRTSIIQLAPGNNGDTERLAYKSFSLVCLAVINAAAAWENFTFMSLRKGNNNNAERERGRETRQFVGEL